MNKLLTICCLSGTLLAALFSCTKQNLPEEIAVSPVLNRSDNYFANLRAYKKSDHQIYFGWFGGFGNGGDPNVPGVLDQIPDSVDIVSCWGGIPPPNTYNDALLKKTQQLKGTRFVSVMFGSGVDNLRLKNFPTLPVLNGIDSVAKSVADSVKKYGMDGFDLDYEPGFGDGGIFGHGGGGTDAGGDIYTQRLFKAFSKYLGPLSGTGKILIIDGQTELGISTYIDYWVQQAYAAASVSALNTRYAAFASTLPSTKYIPAENFESYWATGGVNFSDPVRGTIPSLLGFAYWNPPQGKKGGAGAYHAEYEYPLNPDYKYTRQAIQIMNPATK